MMIDFDKIVFPCHAEYRVDKNFWEDCYVLGIFTEGSTISTLRNMTICWIIITNEGLPKKIYSIEHVRFSKYSNEAA